MSHLHALQASKSGLTGQSTRAHMCGAYVKVLEESWRILEDRVEFASRVFSWCDDLRRTRSLETRMAKAHSPGLMAPATRWSDPIPILKLDSTRCTAAPGRIHGQWHPWSHGHRIAYFAFDMHTWKEGFATTCTFGEILGNSGLEAMYSVILGEHGPTSQNCMAKKGNTGWQRMVVVLRLVFIDGATVVNLKVNGLTTGLGALLATGKKQLGNNIHIRNKASKRMQPRSTEDAWHWTLYLGGLHLSVAQRSFSSRSPCSWGWPQLRRRIRQRPEGWRGKAVNDIVSHRFTKI